MRSLANIIPREVLFEIFRHLSRHNLNQCQLVCKAWELAAHPLFLKNVVLDRRRILLLLQSVQLDPPPLDLRAVKTMTLSRAEKDDVLQNATEFKQIIPLFPNIEGVFLGKFIPFRDCVLEDVCHAIIQSCPKVANISFNPDSLCAQEHRKSYRSHVCGMRYSCTKLYIAPLVDRENLIDPWTLGFLSTAPNLQEVETVAYNHRSRLTDILVILDRSYCLKALTYHAGWGSGRFVEDYLQEKTQEEKDLFLDKLSKLKKFSFISAHGIDVCTVTIQFITQYLTGLENLSVFYKNGIYWSDSTRNVLCNDLLNYICTLPFSQLEIGKIEEHDFLKYSAVAFQKLNSVFPPNIEHVDKRLQIHVTSHNSRFSFNTASRTIGRNQMSRTIEIKCRMNETLPVILKQVVPTMDDIYTLEYVFSSGALINRSSPGMFVFALKAIMDHIPSVSKLVLHAQILLNEWQVPRVLFSFPQIKHLELHASGVLSERRIHESIITAFPEINYLKLYYFCGAYNKTRRLFTLSLEDNDLEWLHLDVSLVYYRLVELLKKEPSAESSFFTIEVNTLVPKNQFLFKVSLDHFAVKKTDSRSMKTSNKPMKVKITVKDLKYLYIYLYPDIIESPLAENRSSYFDDKQQDIKVAKIRLE